ncbi:MAG: DEAD/DEAH box helicase [Blautia sp.]|nr:DEAD/DEAH box helicase [Blautia sp.]
MDYDDAALYELKREERDWRHLFSDGILKQGASEKIQGMLLNFEDYGTGTSCHATFAASETKIEAKTRTKIAVKARYGSYYTVQIRRAPSHFRETWDMAYFQCSCPDSVHGRCVHMAGALFHWEKLHGPWVVQESESDRNERIRKKKTDDERKRRREMRKELGEAHVPVLDFLSRGEEEEKLRFFDFEAALKDAVTNPYHIARAKELQEENLFGDVRITISRDRFGKQTLCGQVRYMSELENVSVECKFAPDRLLGIRSRGFLGDVRKFWYGEEELDTIDLVLDEYELILIQKVWDKLESQEAEEQTDSAALQFFQNLEQAEVIKRKNDVRPREKQKTLGIEPRITVEEGQARLSFKMGRQGGKMLIVRNLSELVYCYEEEKQLELSRTETLDFGEMDFQEESLSWLQFIQRRVREIGDVNEKLSRRNFGYGASLSVSYQQELKGSLLDHFYDSGEGKNCEYQDKTNGVKARQISIGHKDLKLKLLVERLQDARGRFAGVAVSGYLPVLIPGGSAQYVLNPEYLSRISEEEEESFRPFTSVADASGYFRFQVGLSHLNQFYYRVLPKLLENPRVEVDDTCSEEAAGFLPPEAVFVFYLDYESGLLSCKGKVSYEEKEYTIHPRENRGEEYRDYEQENKVLQELSRWFSSYDPKKLVFWAKTEDEEMFRFLTEGIAGLSAYGQVKGTDAFRSNRVRQIPKVQVGVSVKSGLMDLSVTSKEVDEKELLELLHSYSLKKRFHRLRSGDFIDLSEDSELRSTLDFLTGMDLVPDEVIKENAHLPMYRALYLDRMLEEHDHVVSNRDRTYRALIKNFRTVADSEYEPPQSLSQTMRSYQTFGFKWLKTLTAAGFGGILADEMGLGKTLQTIALFLSEKEEGNQKPSLVVCPASLIYNWKEEIQRFAPELDVTVLAGTAGERKTLFAKMQKAQEKGGGLSDVYVTSYDLLKRDIVQYKPLSFRFCVLDEAQYIKNQRAAAAKTVKTVQAEQRLALTGTPIENRLSELWSIFDFLMPGFLYSSEEFINRFENPIAKSGDENATRKLKQMTSPFILRRKKEDVLKDLPAKLEEVRYARFEGEQQRLYDSQVLHMKQLLEESTGSGEEKMRILAELTRIRQICCDPSLIFEDYHGSSAKREACLQLVRSAIDGGHRILLFSQFTSMLALLEQDLAAEEIPFYKITGETPKDKRIALVNAFNEGETPVFLISLKAGGTGLNLTGADVVIHYDPWWNLAAQNQATDRAHRIGQTRQVTVYRVILKDTIEEKILELQEAKKDLAEAILEGRSESLFSMSNEELLALLE